MKKGKLADVGTHEELVSNHKSYTKVLSLNDDAKPTDLDSKDVVRKDSVQGPFSSPFTLLQHGRTTSFQKASSDGTILSSLHNSFAELGTFSTESLNSMPSSRAFAPGRMKIWRNA